jgi:2,4-dienoyl-CoA reductase-like NADH-dependent reductase (Old Yellow Enzyme family)
MKVLIRQIHSYGCPAFLQLARGSVAVSCSTAYRLPTRSAVALGIEYPDLGDCHRDVYDTTIPYIQEINRSIVDAAEAHRSGLRGVDLNMASSHIVHNFLSPFWNRRTDEYGGTQKKRARMMMEIIAGIKERCGADYPVVVCLNGFEVGYAIGVDDGACLTYEQGLENAKWAVETGADAVMVRSHWMGLHVPGYLTDHMFTRGLFRSARCRLITTRKSGVRLPCA